MESQDCNIDMFSFYHGSFLSLGYIFVGFRIVLHVYLASHCMPLSARILAPPSTTDECGCGSKPAKELLYVSSVGVEEDFFNKHTLGVPGKGYKASVRLQDTDLVKRWVRFPTMWTSGDLDGSFRLMN